MTTLYAKVTNPNSGHPHDKEAVAKLCVGYHYAVDRVDMGECSTRIYLDDMKTKFNSVNFTFYVKSEGEFVEYDIFSDPEYNPYL